MSFDEAAGVAILEEIMKRSACSSVTDIVPRTVWESTAWSMSSIFVRRAVDLGLHSKRCPGRPRFERLCGYVREIRTAFINLALPLSLR